MTAAERWGDDWAAMDRWLQVLSLAEDGYSRREMARELHVCEKTVTTALAEARWRLGPLGEQCRTTSQAVAAAIRKGII